jgi:hypothetical protein
MRKSSKLIGALAIAGIAAAGGTAFTASNTMPTPKVVGYGSTTVSGASVNSIAYVLNTAGDNVDGVTLVLNGDTTGSVVSIGFNGDPITSCGTGTPGTSITTYHCDNGGAPFVLLTADLASTAVVVN